MRERDAIVIPASALRGLLLGTLAIVFAVALIAIAIQLREQLASGGFLARGAAAEIDPSTYQAIFLTGGQVYFGQLSVRDDVYLMRDVYYLSEPSDEHPTGQLVKRGNEVHGPREPMIVLRDQVLLIENQRPDSEVMQAIKRFKSGETPPATPAPARTASPRPSPASTRTP